MQNLTLENVTYQYGNSNIPAVRDVNCSFEPGKLYSIAGPSGSGKSTLLSMLAGLDFPSEGDIFFEGISLKKLDLDNYRREKVSMIFQGFHLFPLLRAIENVCYPMELQGMSARDAVPRAEALLQSVGISSAQMRRFPSNLSGGEQQRVAIARSLASGSKFLLADEPTGNLDTENTKNIMDILDKLAHHEGYCVIVVTHDPEVASRADVMFRMADGILNYTTNY